MRHDNTCKQNSIIHNYALVDEWPNNSSCKTFTLEITIIVNRLDDESFVVFSRSKVVARMNIATRHVY